MRKKYIEYINSIEKLMFKYCYQHTFTFSRNSFLFCGFIKIKHTNETIYTQIPLTIAIQFNDVFDKKRYRCSFNDMEFEYTRFDKFIVKISNTIEQLNLIGKVC